MKHIPAPYETYPAEYGVWRNMKQRCSNPKLSNYKDYGGRGIKVCDEWMVFANFLASMGLRPSKKHSIERHDNEGNYEPANCYWATGDQQSNNTRRNIRLTHKGKTLTLQQWADETGLPYDRLHMRYRYGWEAKDILRTETDVYTKERRHNGRSKLLTYKGETLTITQWAKRLGLPYEVIRARHRYGWSTERIIETQAKSRRTK